MKLHILLLCLLAWLCPAVSFGQSDSFTVNGKKVFIQSFDRAFEQVLKATDVPGASVAVINNNQVVYAGHYGVKKLTDKEKVDAETVFEACSLSKSYLVYAAFRLVEEGKLDLDKPVYQYMEPGPALNHDPRYKLITARMILSHCSGIENWKEDNNRDTLEILTDPGKSFVYSGTGYNYLAEAISAIIGKPYETYVKELVLQPLQLKHSYLTFTSNGPNNYATGHNMFGKEIPKWKNEEAVPSSANNVTAEDYAKLIIATFDGKHFSKKTEKSLLTPLISTSGNEKQYYYGPGFEIFYAAGDTIIGHGGNNAGFKGQVFYSVKHKCGFVLLTNGDRGKLAVTALNKLTANLPVEEYYKQISLEEYPDVSIDLFHTYLTKGPSDMLDLIKVMEQRKTLPENTLNALANAFMDTDTALSRKLLQKNIKLFPRSSLGNYLLGNLYKNRSDYNIAYKYYLKAKALQFDIWETELTHELENCRKEIADAERRTALLSKIDVEGKLLLQAEDYNAMHGVEVRATQDTGEGHALGFIDTSDWMNYKVKVLSAGKYKLQVRVSSESGNGRLELRSGNHAIAAFNIDPTKSWESFTTLTAYADLPAGIHTFQVYAAKGGFDLNWIQFTKANSISSKK
ncbi:serine hydrolase [Pedobacter sp. PF22-3]|uniref:serine hydrolase n=1 Tax=Pedobacter sp. PF22-3 TaxID=2994467 RepID=UPI0022464480|nr:serine hydrolase [Pedobacter sp. PF22-3]MCX2492862.1 serine hydrolase [Pedobacter sp. PF22-3]